MGKGTKHSGAREIWAVALVFLALLLLLSLISYDKGDVGDVAVSGPHRLNNYVGPVGAWIALVTFRVWGVAAYILMLVLAAIGVMLLMGEQIPWRGKIGAGLMLLVASSCLLHLTELKRVQQALNLPGSAGGFIGLIVGGFFQDLLGTVGAAIIFIAVYIISLIMLVNFRPSYWVAVGAGATRDFWRRLRGKPALRDELRGREREIRVKEFELERELARKEREFEKEARPEPKIVDTTQPAKPAELKEQKKPTLAEKMAEKVAARKEAALAKPKLEKPAAPPEPKPVEAEIPADDAPYELPTLDLLDAPTAGAASPTNVVEDLKQSAEILRQTLEEFEIPVAVENVTKGPVVTLYEVVPSRGVKVERIAALSNNIALAMKAVTVRILAPVPGKGTVGIEVPNPKSTTVYLRDLLEAEEYRNTKARIPIALGRDVAGRPILADLGDMPHMLIAGATGSGKTVCVNGILASLLFRFAPSDLRLLLIDPKVVEMQHYNALPHLIVPVVTDSKKVPLALRYVINEMEKRFQILARAGVRNIVAFNARERKAPAKPATQTAKQAEFKIEVPRDGELVVPDRMPYIVIIIDELADLMHTAPADVETAIARLTALARAVGIHMVIATQRPSVDVVTGVIKANIPARIAFQVASKQDSRVILDANGADKLLGKGDMLYQAAGAPKLVRAQGVLVSDDEIRRIVDFIGARFKPRFETEIHQKLQKTGALAGDVSEEADEELIEQAIEVIRQTNRASVSVLQRRLRIGYTRAARVMDVLEERGVVGPNKGAEPREILVDLDGKIPAAEQ
jgi:S-DNA-T family DNA segregation ATPase FtsK/SpoIIIE